MASPMENMALYTGYGSEPSTGQPTLLPQLFWLEVDALGSYRART